MSHQKNNSRFQQNILTSCLQVQVQVQFIWFHLITLIRIDEMIGDRVDPHLSEASSFRMFFIPMLLNSEAS